MKALFAMAVSFGIATQAPAARPPVGSPLTEVMVLGTWHFDNPGRDINNVHADDVLKPQRQRELEALVVALASFKPNKIVVERVPTAADFSDPNFSAFTPAKLAKERDERVQVAYRLAHQLGHTKVYAIDEQGDPGEPDYFPFGKVVEAAKVHKQQALLDAAMTRGAEATKEFEEKQKSLAIPALLIDSNDPAKFQSSISGYYNVLGIGDANDQPGADLNAMWYLRNAKIFGKLTKVAAPGDRILVVYGAGHNYWLRHFVGETKGFRNVDPRPYLRKARLR